MGLILFHAVQRQFDFIVVLVLVGVLSGEGESAKLVCTDRCTVSFEMYVLSSPRLGEFCSGMSVLNYKTTYRAFA